MSDENVEIVRRMWDAFLAADFQTALSFYAPDVEWDGTNLPDGRIGRGHDAILGHVTRWAEAWNEWTVEVERIVEAGGEEVIVVVRERGRATAGSRWTSGTLSSTR
jgi:ketosteroid isomerase-like protein